MSGDVQPRKRKDKKRKRDDDEASHGVHITKMAGDDVHLHVHEEHGTGGHWCAKIFFFALLAILAGLIGLIILENRGLADLDTPLSESRFSNYFDGWVEERREEHDEHDAVQHSIEEHDEHDEPFEEEEDHDDDDEHEDEEDDDEHEDDDEEDEDDENVTKEQDEDDDADTAEATAEDDDDDENDEDDEDVKKTGESNDEDDNEDDNLTNENNAAEDEDDDDDDKDDADTQEQTAEDDEKGENSNGDDDEDDEDDDKNNASKGDITPENDEDDDDNDDDDDVSVEPIFTRSARATAQQKATKDNNDNGDEDDDNDNDDDDDDAFDEEDDDGTFETTEKVVDNDAEELLLLQQKARQQAAEAAKNAPEPEDDNLADAAPSWASSLGVKIVVGVALALVARLVLIRKSSNSSEDPATEILMKRRLTIATNEMQLNEADEVPPPLDGDEEYSEEEIEIEEEIEYIIDDDDADGDVNIALDEQRKELTGSNENMPVIGKYVPETFEQLNAMYKPKNNNNDTTNVTQTQQPHTAGTTAIPSTQRTQQQYEPKVNTTVGTAVSQVAQASKTQQPQTLSSMNVTQHNINTMPNINKPPLPPTARAAIATAAAQVEATEVVTREVTHDLDYQPNDVDDDDQYGDEDADDVDEEIDIDSEDYEVDSDDEDDVSDIDDTELMNRLESKYGKLPQANEYESDEDPDDPTWTQIKPKPKETLDGGPQSIDDDFDSFERQLRKANEEMMREFTYQ